MDVCDADCHPKANSEENDDDRCKEERYPEGFVIELHTNRMGLQDKRGVDTDDHKQWEDCTRNAIRVVNGSDLRHVA